MHAVESNPCSSIPNQRGQRLAREIRTALKEPVQLEQAFFLIVVAVTHGLHQNYMLTHHWAKKTAESRKWP